MGASCIGGCVELHVWVWLRACLGVHWQAWHALAADGCAHQGTKKVIAAVQGRISSIRKGGQAHPYLGEETGWETVSTGPAGLCAQVFLRRAHVFGLRLVGNGARQMAQRVLISIVSGADY